MDRETTLILRKLHDNISTMLTDYENPEDTETPVSEEDLYDMFVYVQNTLAELLN